MDEAKILTPDQWRIGLIDEQKKLAVLYDKKNRDRGFENLNLYWGIDNSQYPAEVVADYIKWRRQIVTLNFIRRIIEGLAGSMLTNKYELDFLPIGGKKTQWSNIMKDVLSVDKELLDYKQAERLCGRDGLIYEGVEEIFEDFTYSDGPHIGFRRLPQGHVIFDPFWTSDRVHDCKRAWKIAMMTPTEIISTYTGAAQNNPAILQLAMRNKQRGIMEYGTQEGVILNKNMDTSQGSRLQVVEYLEVKDVMEEYEWDKGSGLELPKTDDVQVKMEWLKRVRDRDPMTLVNDVEMRQRPGKKLMVTAYTPDVQGGAILSEGPHDIQINRLNLFPFSAFRMNGEKSGIVDLVKDPQRMINYRESLITYAIQTRVSGGQGYDSGVFQGDEKLEKEYISRKNDPSYNLRLPPGSSKKFPNWQQSLNPGEFPDEAINQISRMMDMMDRISFHPAAADARTESSSESGVLFAQKAKMAEIANYCINEQFKQHVNDKGEGYLYQAPITYGRANKKREFYMKAGDKSIVLNEHITLFDGSEVVKNQISEIPRHQVIVTESPQGETRKLTTMMVSSDLVSKLDPNANPITKQIFIGALVNSVDVFDAEQTKQLEEADQFEMELAKSKVKAETAKNNQIAMQSQMPPPGAPPQIGPPSTGGPSMAGVSAGNLSPDVQTGMNAEAMNSVMAASNGQPRTPQPQRTQTGPAL